MKRLSAISMGSSSSGHGAILDSFVLIIEGKLVFVANYLPDGAEDVESVVTDMLVFRNGKLHRYFNNKFAAKAIETLRNSKLRCVRKLKSIKVSVELDTDVYRGIIINGKKYEVERTAKYEPVFELADDNLPEIEED